LLIDLEADLLFVEDKVARLFTEKMGIPCAG
jgi:hypothetical protein